MLLPFEPDPITGHILHFYPPFKIMRGMLPMHVFQVFDVLLRFETRGDCAENRDQILYFLTPVK